MSNRGANPSYTPDKSDVSDNFPGRLNRRSFLRSTTIMTAASATGAMHLAQASEPSTRPLGRGALIDTNITLSRWPFRRLPLDETGALVSRLRKHGVTQAWAGSFDGLLHKNLGAVNARLAEECRKNGRGLLLPFGLINPKLPDWEENLRLCYDQYKMEGLRLHPNYHGYKLDDPAFAKLLDAAAERRLVVQIAVSMEDERTQHPLMQVPHVDVTPLPELLKSRPKLRLVLLNCFRAVKGELLKNVAQAGQAFFDLATVEGVGGVADLLKQVPVERVVFGSHAPFFYFESALLKLKESELSAAEDMAIRAANARLLLGGAN